MKYINIIIYVSKYYKKYIYIYGLSETVHLYWLCLWLLSWWLGPGGVEFFFVVFSGSVSIFENTLIMGWFESGGSPYFWCVRFSNGNSNQSFIFEGGMPKISRPGCFSGANDMFVVVVMLWKEEIFLFCRLWLQVWWH